MVASACDSETARRRRLADSAVHLWHEWMVSHREGLGWHQRSIYHRVQELAGFAPVQHGRRPSDPVPYHVIRHEVALTVDGALSELGEQFAKLVLLRVVGRYSFAQIGDQLGLSKHASRRQFQKAYGIIQERVVSRAQRRNTVTYHPQG